MSAEAPEARRLVPGVGFEPTSPRFRRGAFTRLASQALSRGLVRTRRIELLSPEWRSSIEPIKYVRLFPPSLELRRASPSKPAGRRWMVRPRGFEPLVGRPAYFTDAGFTDRWQERDANVLLSRVHAAS